jgi:mevalonate kinase
VAFLGSGSAKLILFGEHAVVHGHPALGIGLPGRLTVKWTPGPTPLVLACPEEYQPAIRRACERIARNLADSRSIRKKQPNKNSGIDYGAPFYGGQIEFESTIPVSAGLGSSGAVCIALARVALSYARSVAGAVGTGQTGTGQESDLEENTIWAAAHEGEQVFHGRPSGVDTGLALWQKLSLFTPQPEGLPTVSFLPEAGIDIVYGTVPREASCAANVAAIGKALAAGNTSVSATLAELGRLSSLAATLLEHTSAAARKPATSTQVSALSQDSSLPSPAPETAVSLGNQANAAMDLLRRLGLSTPAMDAVLAAGLAAGATGGKLSGGGAGGAFWLACPSGGEAARIQAAVIEMTRRLGLPGNAYTGVTTI